MYPWPKGYGPIEAGRSPSCPCTRNTAKEHVVNAYRRAGCEADDLVPESVGRGHPSSVEETRDGGVMFGKNLLSAMSTLWSVASLL